MRLPSRLAATAATVFAATAVHASPTGLFLMPIADILRHREALVNVGLLGYEHDVSKGYDYFGGATVGLFDRVEGGFDGDFRGTTTGNVKLLLHEGGGAALSVGLANWRGSVADPYVVGRLDLRGLRLHGGAWRTMGTTRPMLGIDFPAGPGLTGALEALGGPGGQGWGSLACAIPFLPGLGVQLAVGVPFRHADGLQHAASVYYAFKF